MKGMRLGVNNDNSYFLCIVRKQTDSVDTGEIKRQGRTRRDRDKKKKGRKADMERKMSVESGN